MIHTVPLQQIACYRLAKLLAMKVVTDQANELAWNMLNYYAHAIPHTLAYARMRDVIRLTCKRYQGYGSHDVMLLYRIDKLLCRAMGYRHSYDRQRLY